MSARVPDLLAQANEHVSMNSIDKARGHAAQYESAFLSVLMQYIKDDATLSDFYIRLIYECEIVQIVLINRKNTELWELRDLVNDMKNAQTVKEIAEADAVFHRRLFSIAGEEDFYKWYQLQAKTLNGFLSGFWSYIGYGTDNYKKLMEIHNNIYLAIEKQDTEMAISAMLEHFAILLFQLLSTTFQQNE